MIHQEKGLRYFHTLRYLRPQQFLYRFVYAVTNLKIKNQVTNYVLRAWHKSWSSPEVPLSSLLNTGELCFLGEKASLEDKNIWNDSKRSKLWLYHLHYFDVLNASNSVLNQNILNQLIGRWITENPVLLGNGWEPYPLSLRMANWIKYFSKNPADVKFSWCESLVFQARALMKQLEYHILGNHLFANAKALVFVGAYFDGDESDAWLTKGLRLLDREISEQFLLDGGHFERSPMYHATLLWDMCDLYHLMLITDIQVLKERKKQWEDVIKRAFYWLDAMTHPDGDISFFNDATFGVAPKLHDLKAYACQLDIDYSKTILPVRLLNKTGYCVVEMDKDTKAILDVGEVGPDYQPGHAHADTLSFELSVDAKRVIVNSGISEYGQGERRHYQRGTKAHSTVCIEHTNSSDVWSGFRVGRRARPFDLKLQETPDEIKVACSHNGYLKRSGKNIHRRSWRFNQCSVLIYDSISGNFSKAEARFYLHPDILIVSKESGRVVLNLPNAKEVVFYLESEGVLSVQPTTWHPGFGQEEQNNCIVVAFTNNELITRLGW